MTKYMFATALLAMTLAASTQQPTPLPANYIQVHAPMAQQLAVAVKAQHPEIKKLGLHVTPPSGTANAIIASETASKVGKKNPPRKTWKRLRLPS